MDLNESKKQELKELVDEIKFELMNFENASDPETTDEEWLDVFYLLLVDVKNLISEIYEE